MLENLYTFGTLLLRNNRRLHVFRIVYNNINCNVVFHRLVNPIGYWTIQLDFIKIEENDSLLCYANKIRMSMTFDELRNFFNINTQDGDASRKDIIASFYTAINNQIPTNIPLLNDVQRQQMVEHLQNYEPAEEQNKIYLYDFKKTGNRSDYNNDKAAARYPEIYTHFANDTEYSFFFSADVNKEVTLNQLLEKLEKRSSSALKNSLE